MKINRFKLASAGIMTLAVSGVLTPSLANAAYVTGVVTMNFNNPVLSATTLVPGGGGYYGNNTIAISDWFPGGPHEKVDLAANGIAVAANSTIQNMTFTVNTLNPPSTVINYNNGGAPYDRSTQVTNMLSTGPTNNNSQFSFDGAIKFEGISAQGTPTYLAMTDFNVRRINGVWNILSNDSGFGRNTDFQLKNVVDNLATAGTLEGDIIWGNGDNAFGSSYGVWLSTDGNLGLDYFQNEGSVPGAGQTVIGHFSLSPVAAVPVPSALWLFGSALLGMVSINRKKSGLAS